MRMGSASQLELAAAADVGTGSEAILAWSDLLDFFGSWCICDFFEWQCVYKLQWVVEFNARCEYEHCRARGCETFAHTYQK